MIGTAVFPNCLSVRTHRGERPDKMRHPQSANSTDVMEGSLMATQPNNTTSIEICNTLCSTKRHQIKAQNALAVKLVWLSIVRLILPFASSPSAGAREIAPGPQRCVIMEVLCHYLISLTSERSLP
jgi:hypothetical protein